MKYQKGFSAMYIVFLLFILAGIALGYIYYQKMEDKKFNAESYQQLSLLATRFDDKMNIAQSTPRIGLGAALNDLSTIKSDISTLPVSPCLEPAKASLDNYASTKLKFMTDFAGDRLDDTDVEAYQNYIDSTTTAQEEYQNNLQNCKPE